MSAIQICPSMQEFNALKSAYEGHSHAGYAAKSEAIKSITRSGTTFTATRCDGTKFTFTQQDNNSYPATSSGSGTRHANAASGSNLNWVKWGRVVTVRFWIQSASTLGAYSERVYWTGLPAGWGSLDCSALAIDGGGVALFYVNDSGQLVIKTRSTAIGTVNGGGTYLATSG